MNLKKLIVFITTISLIILFIGCEKDVNKKNGINDSNKVKVSIIADIKEYTPLMSATPGIPLSVKFTNDDKINNFKYHWTTEQGMFLKWEQDSGKITELGKDISLNEENIYWAVDPNSKIETSSFKINLKVEDTKSNEVIETSIEIKQNKEGIFIVK